MASASMSAAPIAANAIKAGKIMMSHKKKKRKANPTLWQSVSAFLRMAFSQHFDVK